jgi:hypothetical protein
MPKAGSTAIQEFLSANRGNLAAAGVTYCHVLRGPNHAQLALAFAPGPNRIASAFGIETPADRARLRSRISRRLAKAVEPGSTWIASSEHLAAMLRTTEPKALAALLGEVFEEVTVVAVLRRADYWLPSAYVEAVKGGRRRPMRRKFVRQRRHLLNHRAFVRRWESAFGVGCVRLVPFLESDKHDPAALPLRTLEAAGIVVDDPAAWLFPPGQVNISMSAYACEVLRRLNPRLQTVSLRPTTERRRIISIISRQLPGRAAALSPAAAAALAHTGWGSTRISETRYAVGSEWSAWRDEPPGPVARRPRISRDALDAIFDELQRSGVIKVRRTSPHAARATAAVRRRVLRLARR